MDKSVNKQRTILFTGGGSAGHVTPNIALIEYFLKLGWDAVYIGSYHGIERDIIKPLGIPYYGIATGKLRRHFSWRTFMTPWQVLLGIYQAFCLCRRIKPAVVFSKGGFVAFPVVFAAWLTRIPCVGHESDLTPGLANRLSFPFIKKICVTFPEGATYFKDKEKVLVTGTPIRKALLQGDAARGLAFCGFSTDKPVLLIYGGGLGAENINRTIRAIVQDLLKEFQVVHICGQHKMDNAYQGVSGYLQYEYLNTELADVMACASFVISRAGANSICELLALRKPHILIPLSKKASRGDQLINADYFAKQGLSVVILEEALTGPVLLNILRELVQQQQQIQQRLSHYPMLNSVELIANTLMQEASGSR